MIKISKQNNSLIVEGIDNVFYPNNGDNSYTLNSLIVVTDNSDMATFRSVATNDVLFSGLIKDITINGEAVTKDNIIEKFDATSNSSTGGGGGGTVDAYTKEEADNKFATKTELTNVQTVANDADTKVDALTPRVEGIETAMDGKQATLVSGENIKTINGESVLGEGNIEVAKKTDIPSTDNMATKDELTAVETVANNADAKADAATSRIESVETAMGNKQDTLVSGTNIKTVNSQSILGEGNIEVSGVSEEQAQEIAKIPTLETELAQKANVSDVATAQIGYAGDDKHYIYTNFSSPYTKAVSKIGFVREDNNVQVRVYSWSSDTSESAYTTETLSKATTLKAGVMTAADKTKLDSISNEWTGTQSEYDALTTKDNNTIYYVTE